MPGSSSRAKSPPDKQTSGQPDVADDGTTYECVGDFGKDFPALCDELGCFAVKVHFIKKPEGNDEEVARHLGPAIELELDQNDKPLSAKVCGWPLTVPSCKAFLAACEAASISDLRFYNAGLSDEHIQEVLMLESNPIQQLVIHNNNVALSLLPKLISSDEPKKMLIRSLTLRSCGIDDAGAQQIAQALYTNYTLANLNLNGNQITDTGAVHLFKTMRVNRTLRVLSLARNQIGDHAINELCLILTEYPLTHEETVLRRRLMYNSGSDALSINSLLDSPTRPDGKRNSGGSGKTTARKSATPKKEDKSAKGRKTTAPKGKKGKGSQDDDDLANFRHPFLDAILTDQQGRLLCPGNSAINAICLSCNKISAAGVKCLLAAVQYQENHFNDLTNCLLRLRITGNQFSDSLIEYKAIEKLLAKRDPYNSEG